ncbi:hypothetical protein Ciccas_002914 [Cichlidogyrus casuarinus]|uniref:FERM domain-containing protein n=1 Tax=Cichlidogyrus casuarinus TaxID=1844966 RepID=A0ABD2QFV4_9PLAT
MNNEDDYQYRQPKPRSSDNYYNPNPREPQAYARNGDPGSVLSTSSQPRSKPRSNRRPPPEEPYWNSRDPIRPFSPYSGSQDQRSDIEKASLGYINDNPRRGQEPDHPGSFHSGLISADGNHSRRDSNATDNQQHFWTPDVNGTVPRGSQAKIAAKKDNPFSKLFASMRRGKSQQSLNEDLTEPRAPSKSRFRSLSRSEAAQLSPTKVIMLDGTEQNVSIDKSHDTGRVLFQRVCDDTQIMEVDFFGLTYQSRKHGTWFWLELDTKISKQLSSTDEWTFFFQVKFYAPEPCLLQEDITRYYLVLQLRQDIYTGKLPCSWVTQALLGSFTLQSEIGDYDSDKPLDLAQLRSFQFVRNPTTELLTKIQELHKSHQSVIFINVFSSRGCLRQLRQTNEQLFLIVRPFVSVKVRAYDEMHFLFYCRGLTPEQADLRYLETAKRLELYGIDLHPARDMENVLIHIGVGYQGVVIYRDNRRIGRFAWPKVLRISYEKNQFYLTIRPDHTDPVEAKIGFRLHNNMLAKRLWMSAVDHHAFFRLKETKKTATMGSTRIGTLKRGALGGSQHQLSSRTFFQNRNTTISRPNPQFDRAVTKQLTASMPMGLNQEQYGSVHSLRTLQDENLNQPDDQRGEASFYQHPRDAYGGSAHELAHENSYHGSEPDSQGYLNDYRHSSRGGPDSFNGSVLSAEGRRGKHLANKRFEIDENEDQLEGPYRRTDPRADYREPVNNRPDYGDSRGDYNREYRAAPRDGRKDYGAPARERDYGAPSRDNRGDYGMPSREYGAPKKPMSGAWSYGVPTGVPPVRKNRRTVS